MQFPYRTPFIVSCCIFHPVCLVSVNVLRYFCENYDCACMLCYAPNDNNFLVYFAFHDNKNEPESLIIQPCLSQTFEPFCLHVLLLLPSTPCVHNSSVPLDAYSWVWCYLLRPKLNMNCVWCWFLFGASQLVPSQRVHKDNASLPLTLCVVCAVARHSNPSRSFALARRWKRLQRANVSECQRVLSSSNKCRRVWTIALQREAAYMWERRFGVRVWVMFDLETTWLRNLSV